MDYLFSIASVNVSMMNFHGGGEGPYTAIGYHNTTDQVRKTVEEQPRPGR